jgi:hypothetical protein
MSPNRAWCKQPEHKPKEKIMGYTHYWQHTKRFTNDQWRAVREDLNAIICTAQEEGTEFGDEMGGEPLTALNQFWGTDSVVTFNGLGDAAHETFVIYQNRAPLESWQDKSNRGAAFCKTARKPYDSAVVACLVYLESVCPHHFNASSDGYAHEWADGLALAKRALPRLGNVLRIPAEIEFGALFSQYHYSGGKLLLATLKDGTFCIADTKARTILGRFNAGEATTWLAEWLRKITEQRRAMLPARCDVLDRWDARKMRTLAEAAPTFGYFELTHAPI